MAQVIEKKQNEPGVNTNKTLRNGSSGTDVKALQTALINAGYDVGSTGADGVYGSKTAAAVKAYQQANGLAVDGIAGKNTLSSLYGGTNTLSPAATNALNTLATGAVNAGVATLGGTNSNNNAGSEKPAASNNPPASADAKATEQPKVEETKSEVAPFTYQEFTYDPYGESDIVQQARTLLAEHEANKLGEYKPVWLDEAEAYLSQYQNRDPFSYDPNSDALYNYYKDAYVQQGQMAMMDAMGQAASMTGGYGNSYAQTVGQQAYNQSLSQLNNVLPELYQMAHDNYTQEGQDLLNMYGLYMDRENQEYSKYQDSLNNWYTQLEYLTDRYETERATDYNKWLAGKEMAHDDYLTDKDLAYKEYRAAIDDAQWQAEFDEDTRRYEQNRADELGLSTTGSSGGGGGGSSSSAIREEQQKYKDAGYNIAVDGIEGPETRRARDAFDAGISAEEFNNSNGSTGDGGDGGRDGEIENWVATALANVRSPSFDMNKVIDGTSFLKTPEERAYAKEVAKYFGSV